MGLTHFALLVVCLAILGPFTAAEEKQQQQEEKKDNQRNKRQVSVTWTEETIRREFESVQVPVMPSSVTVAECFVPSASLQANQLLVAAITSVFGSPEYDDIQAYQPLLHFFLNGGAYTIIQEYGIDVTAYSTVAQLFSAIIADALQDASVQANGVIFGALQYYAGRIISQGPSPTQSVTITVDWPTIFSSFDFNAINENLALSEALYYIIQFVAQPAFQPFLQRLQAMQINNNAELLSSILQFVAAHAESQELASGAYALLSYVQPSGLGAIQSGFTIYGYGYISSGYGSNLEEHVAASKVPKRQHHAVHHKVKLPHGKPVHKAVRPRPRVYLG